MRSASALALALLVGCGGSARARLPHPASRTPLPALTLPADSSAADSIRPGLRHYAFVIRSAPWAIHVLDVDRAACWTLASLKAANHAVGRARTTALLASATAAAGVNADFFTFTPAGVPQGASVHHGRVLSGPAPRPVFALDSAGRAWIGVLELRAFAAIGGDTFPIEQWNRRSGAALAWFDTTYGAAVDTATHALRILLGPGQPAPVNAIDSSGAWLAIPRAGGVLSLGAGAPAALRRRLVAAGRSGNAVALSLRIAPFHPLEAVGGSTILVRDSVEVPGLDSAGAATFAPVRHPRTLVGVAAGGRRILLVAVDGRQPGYSEGMTLREAARLLLDLGATQGLNLDGGGSTTLALGRSRGDSIRYEIVNRPSDRDGERPVSNALAVTSGCARN